MKEEEGLRGECGGGERYSRDLLQRFRLVNHNVAKKLPCKQPNEETEELEPSLGLSLGSRFGIEKSKGLTRSSSVAGTIPFWEVDLGLAARTSDSFPSIARTSSLPTEAEEDLRKRKEWQSLRRMEVKRRCCEKQRKGGDKDCGDEIIGQMTINFINKPELSGNGRVPCIGKPSPSFGQHGSAAKAVLGLIGVGGLGILGSKGKEGILGAVGGSVDGSYGLVGYGLVKADGSAEFQCGGSSGSGGGSDSEARPIKGSSTGNETKDPISNGLLRDDSMISPAVMTQKEGSQVVLPNQDVPEIKPKVQAVRSMEETPGVFTKGDGPNGVRVDGILYKYGKGVEVRIMCVCHGKFLSPAEFVKHAGGGDVANPRRHIFIDTSTVFLQ